MKQKKRATQKRPKAKAPPVDRTQYRRGAFELETVSVDLTSPTAPEGRNALLEILEAATPRGRVAKWKSHAERLGVGLEELAAAEALIDEHGSVRDMTAFNLHVTRARESINLTEIEKTVVPPAVYGTKAKSHRRKGAEEARRATIQDRRERNAEIQETINRLCLTDGHSFKRARELAAREFHLHPDSIKRLTKNPLK